MTKIALLTPSITTRDAVSNDVLGMYDVLGKRGYDVRIFAEGWALKHPPVWSFTDIRRYLKQSDDILIYHYSRGWDPGLELLRSLKCRTVVRYHNVTPPQYFVPYNSAYAEMCLEGRKQLNPIATAGSDLYLSASSYNMRELLTEGALPQRSFVVPPFHLIDRLQSIDPDQMLFNKLNDGKTNICMVGRVSPNKGHPALIEGFAAYFHDYNRHSRLLIVGKEETRLANYSSLLREMVRRLGLTDAVIFAGEVSDYGLRACYDAAHIFMITSDHEGFCVPLVEAMAHRVPVVAYASSAIPDTVSNAGLVWEQRDPYLLAESVNTITTDCHVSAALGNIGRSRYEQHFSNEKIEAKMLQALNGLL